MAETCPFDVTPLAVARPIRNVTNVSTNYTNQEFYGLKTRIVELIRQRFPEDFTDFVESSLGIMLIEVWAFIGDMLSFKIDQLANEVFIDTVREVDNAFRLANLIGFKPQPPIASTAMFIASINQIFTTDVIIPSPLIIQYPGPDNQPRQYELFPADSDNNPILDQDVRIAAGTASNSSLVGVEGTTVSQQVTAIGGANQFIQLDQFPVLWNSIRVNVDGVEWDAVEYFTDSQERREFRVEYSSSYQAFVIFGNQSAGLMPNSGSRIETTYRIGGGTSGNVVTGALSASTNVPQQGATSVIVVNFQNYTRGSGGYNGDTIDDVKRKLPAYVRTQGRCVTGLDYKTYCDQFATPYAGQVGKSTAVLRNAGCAGNVVDLYVLAREGRDDLALPGSDLKAALTTSLNRVKMFTDFLCLRDGVIVAVDVYLDLVLDRVYRKFEEEIRAKVINRVNAFFSLNAWEYGQTLRSTDLIKAISDVPEISQINVTFTSLTNQPTQESPDACTPADQIVTTRFYEIIRPEDVFVQFNYMSTEEL
jgi:hypothetical protein